VAVREVVLPIAAVVNMAECTIIFNLERRPTKSAKGSNEKAAVRT